MKKTNIYSVIVALGLMVSSAVSQTINYVNVIDKACFGTTSGQGVCVEIVTNKWNVVTEYCVKEGKSTFNIPLFGYRIFSCIGSPPCISPLVSPYDGGVRWIWGLPFRVWWLPVYSGEDSEVFVVNNNTRVIGVPSNYTIPYFKIYQMLETDTLALVFKNGRFLCYYKNPKATQKFPKNTEVVIVNSRLHSAP